nr:MAG TPA: hypothetical protein [Bacteriophage sp.]
MRQRLRLLTSEHWHIFMPNLKGRAHRSPLLSMKGAFV